MSKEIFITIGQPKEDGGRLLRSEIQDDINTWMATAKNFKKAYELAMFIGEIKKPNVSYRQALTRYKDDGIVFLSDESDEIEDRLEEGRVFITTIKQY